MPLTLDFKDKLVLVTGGGRGIGWAITQALANAGADLAITYTSIDATQRAEELSQLTGTRVRAFKCEITSSQAVNEMVLSVEHSFGKKVDIGIANAGITLWKDAHENLDDEFQNVFAVNVHGPYYFARALARSWLNLPLEVAAGPPSSLSVLCGNRPVNLGKQLLFISSISAHVAMTPQRQAAYNASKGALSMLSKSLAAEWAQIGVMVNAISPGYVSTDMIANPPDETAKAWVGDWNRRTPVGRFATADEIGEFLALLVSSKQGGLGWMTGSDIIVDGGYTLL